MDSITWRFAGFAIILAIACITRELTALLLWWTFIVTHRQAWRWGLLYTVIVIGILFVLRLVIPAAPSVYTIAYTWQLNTAAWRLQGAILYQGLLLPVWILLFQKLHGEVSRQLKLIILPYLVLIALLGVWQEVRLLMPVFILGIPFSRAVFKDL